jgi:hypothetical protein
MKNKASRTEPTLESILDDARVLARGLPIVDCRSEVGPLLRPDGNQSRPIHRWFKFKESFSAELIGFLLNEYWKPSRRSVSFLDPFCGVATSLLAAEEVLPRFGARSVDLRGIEVNPYIHFAAATKLDWKSYDPAALLRSAEISSNGIKLPVRPQMPLLSTLRNAKFASVQQVEAILEMRDKICLVTKGKREQRPLLLGLAAAAESQFNLRKDGRALRYVERDRPGTFVDEVRRQWSAIAEDLQQPLIAVGGTRSIVRGDGRRPDRAFRGQRFDIVCFSPPYLNNIDYTEVYKLEQWLLGYLSSGEEMVGQRRRTFRSHPSCLFPAYSDAQPDDVTTLLGAPFVRLLKYASITEQWRSRLFGEYFADMKRTLEGVHRVLATNGRVFIIIGNSLHGNKAHPIPVMTDLLICRLAKEIGFAVESLVVGRDLHRRTFNTTLMRESVIVLSRS